MPVKTSWWLWPNLLGLDIPVLALVWQEAFAQGAGVELGSTPRISLFMAVWLIYLLDRVWDSVRCVPGPETAARHQFAHRHRRAMLAMSAGLILALLGLSEKLSATLWLAGGVLAAVVTVYFVWNQWIRPGRNWGWTKEALIAGIFALGCALASLVARPSLAFTAPLAAFAFLCLANTLFIAVFEHSSDRERGERSAAGGRFDWILPWTCLGLSVLLVAILRPWPRFSAAVGLAATVLAFSPWVARRFGPEAASRLADAALLAPVLFF